MRRYSGGGWIRQPKRWAIYLRDAVDGIPVCRICGDNALRLASTGRFLTLDHLVPRAVGGSNERTNLRTVCNLCNMRRRLGPVVLDDADHALQQTPIAPLMAAARAILEDRPWWLWKMHANTHVHFAAVARNQMDLYSDAPPPDPGGHAVGDEDLVLIIGTGEVGCELPF